MTEHFDKIMESCKRNNKQAQLALFRLFAKEVYNSSFRILKDSCQAEEVTQDTFLKFFDKIGKSDSSAGSVRAYLKRIAINRSIDIYRRRGAITFISIDENNGEHIDNEEQHNYDQCLTIAKVKETLDKLPEGYRIVLTLRLIEEMDFEDIAQQLSITASTVRSQYARGRERLRHNLEKER